MARIAVMTWRFELRIWMIRPDVGRLHACVSILAVGNCVPRQTLHKVHLTHTASGILYEPKPRFKLSYEFKDVFVNLITEFRIIAHRI